MVHGFKRSFRGAKKSHHLQNRAFMARTFHFLPQEGCFCVKFRARKPFRRQEGHVIRRAVHDDNGGGFFQARFPEADPLSLAAVTIENVFESLRDGIVWAEGTEMNGDYPVLDTAALLELGLAGVNAPDAQAFWSNVAFLPCSEARSKAERVEQYLPYKKAILKRADGAVIVHFAAAIAVNDNLAEALPRRRIAA